MIINDFEFILFLNKNKNVNVFILLDDSLRSFIIISIIKKILKKKYILEDINDFENNKYTNSIIIFKDILNKKNVYKLLQHNNIIIFILQNFEYKNYINKKIIIVLFKHLTYKESFLWMKQFFIYKSFYFNDKIINYLTNYFKNKLDSFIITFESKMYIKTSFLDLLLEIRLNVNNDFFFLENLYKKKINTSLNIYKNIHEYTSLLENYQKLKTENNFILYLFVILDINTKNGTISNSELILFNFMIDNFFEKNFRNENFDKFNIKYITEK
ncbi:MAG TPA: hypothetical protein ACYCDA_00980 [Candidatus Azoamicus sp.]